MNRLSALFVLFTFLQASELNACRCTCFDKMNEGFMQDGSYAHASDCETFCKGLLEQFYGSYSCVGMN